MSDTDTDTATDYEAAPPVVCDLTGATDTLAARMAEYQRLFAQSLLRRSPTSQGIRFCFRADPGLGTGPGRPREGLLRLLHLRRHRELWRGLVGCQRHRRRPGPPGPGRLLPPA